MVLLLIIIAATTTGLISAMIKRKKGNLQSYYHAILIIYDRINFAICLMITTKEMLGRRPALKYKVRTLA